MLAIDVEEQVGVLTFTRPDRRNALDGDLLAALDAALDKVTANSDVRAIVVTGEGPAFMAGADVKLMHRLASNPPAFRQFIDRIQAVTRRIRSGPVPCIAAVGGAAVGAGAELACACDFRLASADATFSFPEASLGLVVTSGASHLLAGLVGAGVARRLLLGGDTVDAAEARRIGLVDGVVDRPALREEALALGRRVAAADPFAVAQTRRLLDLAQERSFEATLAAEVDTIVSCITEGDAGTRLGDFVQRRRDGTGSAVTPRPPVSDSER